MSTTDAMLGAAREANEERVGRYVILSQVGQGGMGTVYKAWDPDLERVVAIKFIHGDPARFRREATALASLRHPNIVPIFETGPSYLVMAFIDGPTLDREPLEPKRAAELVALAARAVHAAHEKGILHRDLKPGNLMLDSEGRLYVTDFGLARRLDEAITQSGVVLGTPKFMAPEQEAGQRDLDARADVWSLGATLHALGLRSPIVEKAMSLDRRRRYATALELAEDLERFARGEAILAKPESRIRKLTRAVRRNPPAWALGAVALLSVAIGVGVIGRQQTELRRLEVVWHATKLPAKYRELEAIRDPEKLEAELAKLEDYWHATSLPEAMRGTLLLRQGRTEEALPHLEEAARKPDPFGAVRLLRWKIREGRLDDVREELLRISQWPGWEDAPDDHRWVLDAMKAMEKEPPEREELRRLMEP